MIPGSQGQTPCSAEKHTLHVFCKLRQYELLTHEIYSKLKTNGSNTIQMQDTHTQARMHA